MIQNLSLSRRALMGTAAAAAIAAAARPAAAQTLETVNAISTQGIAGAALQTLATNKGFWKEQGLNVNYLGVSDATKTVAALVSGSADICLWSGMGSVLVAIERSMPLKIIGGSLLFPTHTVYSKRADIQKVADLKGKTIGIGALGSQLHQVMLALLVKNGIDPSSVIFRNVGSSTDIFRAVVAGTVDAGPAEIDSSPEVVEQKYGVHPLSDGHLYEDVPEFTFQAAYATNDAIAKKRDLLVRSLAVMSKTYRYVMTPACKDDWVKAYLQVAGKNANSDAVSLYEFNIKHQPYDAGLVLGPDCIAFMQKLNVDMGNQKKTLPYSQVADMSLAKDALKIVKS